MPHPPNPDIFHPMAVPASIEPFVRRVLVADRIDQLDMTVDVRATGYHYLGWTWRGHWTADVDGEQVFDSDHDGPLHLSGQVVDHVICVRFNRDIGQIFLEFSALGHYQLFGIQGVDMIGNAAAPQNLNPALSIDLAQVSAPNGTSVDVRLKVLADALSRLPVHAVPDGLAEAVDQFEKANGKIRMSDVLRDLGLAERKFRADFKRIIGVPPKTFCKILQINRALNQLIESKGHNLVGVAAEAGFADQAHFTRAFGAFLGNSPARYLENIETTLARFLGQSRG